MSLMTQDFEIQSVKKSKIVGGFSLIDTVNRAFLLSIYYSRFDDRSMHKRYECNHECNKVLTREDLSPKCR